MAQRLLVSAEHHVDKVQVLVIYKGMQNKLPMREVHATGMGSLGAGIAARRAPGGKSGLLSDGSIREKAFRLGSSTVSHRDRLRAILNAVLSTVCFDIWILWSGVGSWYELAGVSTVVFFVAHALLAAPQGSVGGDHAPRLQVSVVRLLVGWCAVVVVTALVARSLGLSGSLPRNALIGWLLTTPLALVCFDHGLRRTANWWLARRPREHRHIIIGATEVGLELAKRVEHSSGASSFMGFFDFRDLARLPQVAPKHWAGPCDGVAEFVRRNSIDAIYIALPISTSPRISDLVMGLRDTTASVYFVPNILAFDLVQPRCTELHGIPVLAVCESPFQGGAGWRKRGMDLLLASVGLIVLAPLLLLIAAAVRLTSPGPALFRQRRYGLGGEEIRVHKFRTMYVCEDSAVVTQARRGDERVTPLGRILRCYSLDELPQLLNVLQGSMSIVGPRPHAVTHNEQYRKLISGYMIRHKVRPGITGWAQVNGLRGETETLEKMHTRVEYDLDYIRNWSMWLDLKIMLRTFIVVAHDKQAY